MQGYKPAPQIVKQRRPFGVGLLATIGMLTSLAALLVSLVQMLQLLGASARPSMQLAITAGVLVLALIGLWINWGFWDMIRWAWWANLLLTLISSGALVAALRWTQPLGAALAKLLYTMTERQVLGIVMIGLLALLVYHLIALVYMLAAHAAFGVGVKDERPIWERARR
jgi:hypothetical protein